MDTNSKPARTYQRPAWLSLLAIAMVIMPLIAYGVMIANGMRAFDGRGILILIVIAAGLKILSTGKGGSSA